MIFDISLLYNFIVIILIQEFLDQIYYRMYRINNI